MIIPPIISNTRPAAPSPAASLAAPFASTLAAPRAGQNVPGLGTFGQALSAEKPLAIIGAAARGFLLGGPIGAAVSGGVAALGPFFHLPLPAGDGVTGDRSVVQRTTSALAAYAPHTASRV